MQQPPGWPPQGPQGPQYPQQPPQQGYGYPPQNPYGQQPHGYPPQPPPYQPPQADPVASAANLSIGLGIGSLVLCCLPIGGVGAYFGIRSMRLAKERGVSTPVRAIVGIILGSLSLLATLGLFGAYWADKKQHDVRLAEVDAKTKGKLDSDELSKSTACALFEKQLLKGLYDGKEFIRDVKCDGDYDTKGSTATLDKVSFSGTGADRTTVRGCFARATRWFVEGFVPYGQPCPDVTLSTKKHKDASDSELDSEEDELRKTWQSAADKLIADEYAASIAKLASLKSAEHEETACKGLDLGSDDKGTIATVDGFVAAGGKSPKGEDWSFLTSTSIRDAIDTDKPATDRAKAARAAQQDAGAYVLVYYSTERGWPEVKHGSTLKKGFLAGGFVGWMSIVDVSKKKIVCETKLSFENSDTVATKRFSDDGALLETLKSDLTANYKTAAKKALESVSGGKLTLRE